MKQKKDNGQKRENKILQYVVLGCVFLVAGISVLAGGYLRSLNKEAEADLTGQAETETLVKEAGAVSAEENLSRSFINRDPLTVTEGDTREVIRIVEVIPHEICSVFPYLVEWGSTEEYDRQTPLGYEGLRYMASKQELSQFLDQGLYNIVSGGRTSDTLKDYDVPMTNSNDSDRSAYWWRETDMNNKITADGYFEYVGAGKGLYHINLDELVDESDENAGSEYGIRYDIMAMERDGDEAPAGEWQVNDPAYFWEKGDGTSNFPTTDIKRITDYNYDLKFEKLSADSSGYTYRVNDVSVKLTADLVTGQTKCEYQAFIKDGADWEDGYVFWENGNYVVDDSSSEAYVVRESDLSDLSNLSGKYIRIADDENSDDNSQYEAGYFRLFNQETDGSKIAVGDVLYDLVFTAVEPGKGMYVLDPAAVSSALKDDTQKENLEFAYSGEKVGTCAVTFIYASVSGDNPYTGTLYTAEILKVTNGDGSYALTSCAPVTEELYVKEGDGDADYSKVVTRIDCAGIDYTSIYVNEWYSQEVTGFYNADIPGMCMGRDPYNVAVESGGWVFHTISSDEENGITKIEELEDGSIPSNKRIYVYSQKRFHRYYKQNGFKNNEWFKLLIYLTDASGEKGLAEDDYAAGMEGQAVVEKYREELDKFDASYRIEIIQRTPSALTVEEVESADLIYISDQEGIYGLYNKWDDINAYLGGTLPEKPESFDAMMFQDDFDGEVLQAIYDNCLYHDEGDSPTTAIMISNVSNIRAQCIDGVHTKNNMGKLYFLLEFFYDPADFSHFMEGYTMNSIHQANDQGYSTIHRNSGATITVYPQYEGLPETDEGGNKYNQGLTVIDPNAENYGMEVSSFDNDQWCWRYFVVNAISIDENGVLSYLDEPPEDVSLSYRSIIGAFMDDIVSIYNKDVTEDYQTWFTPLTAGDNFVGFEKMHNIWKIMHQRSSKKTSSPKVIVSNSDYMKKPELDNGIVEYYFYVDEFLSGDVSEFTIDYSAIWTPEEVTNPNALTALTVARSDGSVIRSEVSPTYQTTYSCNVAGDFLDAEGKWNGTRIRQYLITATDAKDKSNTVSVYVIFRDSFMLN